MPHRSGQMWGRDTQYLHVQRDYQSIGGGQTVVLLGGTNELHGVMMWGRSLFRWDIPHSTVYGVGGDTTHGVGAYLGDHEFPLHQRYKSH